MQRSPGRQPQQQQQDLFPTTPTSQTLMHHGMSEDRIFLSGQNPGEDLFEQSHVTRTDSSTTNKMTGAPLDGSMSMLPQLGDSEEKLRQVGLVSHLLKG